MTILAIVTLALCGCAQKTETAKPIAQVPPPAKQAANPTPPNATYLYIEAACASCVYGMVDVVGCQLAVNIDGKLYLVRGSHIDDHGDAHAANGLCNTTRTARALGHIEGDTFVATRFELLPK